jgi:hypothetical protein
MGANGRRLTALRERRGSRPHPAVATQRSRTMRATHTLTGPLAAALAVATLAAPASAATTSGSHQRSAGESTIRVYQDLRSPDARDAAAGRGTHDAAAPAVQDLRSPDARDAAEGRTTYVVPPLVKLTPGRDGFDWGDAAIGAAGASGLLAISLAGAMTLRRRQTRPRSRVAVG